MALRRILLQLCACRSGYGDIIVAKAFEAMNKPRKSSVSHRLSRQIGPVHFEDFSSKNFERLVFCYALHSKYPDAEWHGQAGSDGGRDIWCPKTKTVFLCANYKALNIRKVSVDLKKIILGKIKPSTVVVAAGGTISATLREKIKQEAGKLAIPSVIIWSGVELEEQIRIKAPELLARFLKGEEFPDRVQDLRALAIKPQLQIEEPLQPTRTRLSDQAVKLLYAMAEGDDGCVVRADLHEGYSLTVNKRDFVLATISNRIKARWERALTQLRERKFITENGSSDDIFLVTNEGYDVIEILGTKAVKTTQD